MLNQIMIQGRLAKDPELRYTRNQTPVATFSVAVQRDYDRDKADFINVAAWRQTAEFVDKYLRKGQMVIISGSLQMRDYEDRDGKRRTVAEVVADHVYFCESKRDRDNDDGGSRYSANYHQPASSPVNVNPGFTECDEGDGVLPF